MNQTQLQVVRSPHHFIFLFAGAGTGKTTVLMARIQYLLNQGISPSKILALTFTRKSAQDMRSRFKEDTIHFQTFHAWCYAILDTQHALVDENIPFSTTELTSFSVYKNNLKKGLPPFNYYKYEKYLANYHQIDYDDLLLLTLKQTTLPSYDVILIDEFQDTNLLQFELLKRLVNQSMYVFAVGDPDQSIYKFRGANQHIIERFIAYFNAKTYLLHQNYRSDQMIILLANHLIAHDRSRIPKILHSTKKEKGLITVHTFTNDQDEAHHITSHIKKSTYHRSEIAILCRTHQRMYQMKQTCHEFGLINGIYPNIHILTIHEAKGLEFDVVYIIGLEQNVIPGIRFNQTHLEEERRLLYVAITRARHALHLSYIVSKHHKPSQFLHEIKTFQPTKNGQKMV